MTFSKVAAPQILARLTVISLAVIALAACEIPTKLAIGGGNPPTFRLSGNGTLTSLRVRGPHKQREAEGENASMYWVIKRSEGQSGDTDCSESVFPIPSLLTKISIYYTG